jgi:hypothetical protein
MVACITSPKGGDYTPSSGLASPCVKSAAVNLEERCKMEYLAVRAISYTSEITELPRISVDYSTVVPLCKWMFTNVY